MPPECGTDPGVSSRPGGPPEPGTGPRFHWGAFALYSRRPRGIRTLAIMLKQLLAVVAGAALALAVFAAEDVELRADHPDVYVVQRGDSLWDIAG